LNIKWPSKKVIVSEKDKKAMSFKEFKKIILK
jgi:dTDP-4-dehydrorhamnose 3,5-epimerase-like enzyme